MNRSKIMHFERTKFFRVIIIHINSIAFILIFIIFNMDLIFSGVMRTWSDNRGATQIVK